MIALKYGPQTPNPGLVYHLNAIFMSIKIKKGTKPVFQSDGQVTHRSELYGMYYVLTFVCSENSNLSWKSVGIGCIIDRKHYAKV